MRKSKLIMKQLKDVMLDLLTVFIFVFKCKGLLGKKTKKQCGQSPSSRIIPDKCGINSERFVK